MDSLESGGGLGVSLLVEHLLSLGKALESVSSAP